METTAMPTGIRPIERPQGPQTTGVQRRGTPSASPFAPRTDVSLQNSVSDVANLLSKIASTKEEAMDKISPQLQKLIDSDVAFKKGHLALSNGLCAIFAQAGHRFCLRLVNIYRNIRVESHIL